ncbi:MAG: LysM peptidoglycan-binding domain-containing protein [Chloroflexota bacterium]
MRKNPSRRSNLAAWLVFSSLALILTACFQAAGDSIEPSPVNLTSIAPLQETPFVTPLSTGGFVLPTDDPNSFLTPTPLADTAEPPTAVAPTSEAATAQPALPTIPPTIANTEVNPVLLATPTALPTEGPCIHTVQPGEWFYSIARKYNLNPAELVAANPRQNPDSLQPGDVLNIPKCNQPSPVPTSDIPPTATPPNLVPVPAGATNPPTPIELSGRTYSVAEGDTLGAIARKFGTTVQALKDANGLTNDFLRVGEILKIPKGE